MISILSFTPHLALLLALVSRGKVRQVKVPMFEAQKLSRGIAHNAGVYDGLGLGALVKAARPTSATSCKLSTVTNVNNETERLLAH
jgi:hypothetical protein